MERYDRPGKKIVQNLWNPLSPMHYVGAVNLSKYDIYHFMNMTFRREKIGPWSKVVSCTLAGGCRVIDGLNLPVMPDGLRNMSRTQVSAGSSR